jgi:hypothetical protein
MYMKELYAFAIRDNARMRISSSGRSMGAPGRMPPPMRWRRCSSDFEQLSNTWSQKMNTRVDWANRFAIKGDIERTPAEFSSANSWGTRYEGYADTPAEGQKSTGKDRAIVHSPDGKATDSIGRTDPDKPEQTIKYKGRYESNIKVDPKAPEIKTQDGKVWNKITYDVHTTKHGQHQVSHREGYVEKRRESAQNPNDGQRVLADQPPSPRRAELEQQAAARETSRAAGLPLSQNKITPNGASAYEASVEKNGAPLTKEVNGRTYSFSGPGVDTSGDGFTAKGPIAVKVEGGGLSAPLYGIFPNNSDNTTLLTPHPKGLSIGKWGRFSNDYKLNDVVDGSR